MNYVARVPGSISLPPFAQTTCLSFENLQKASVPGERSYSRRCLVLYDRALRFARSKNYKGARRAFQTCVTAEPEFSKAWISWAQLEKRTLIAGQEDNLNRCRRVLQQGLTLNPTDAKLLQAWGLMELQRGNILAAVLLLERCVQYEPRCRPVLQWRAVQVAKASVANRLQKQLQISPEAISITVPVQTNSPSQLLP